MRKAQIDESIWASQVINPGDVLLSHTATRAVPSAPKSLTTEFGMGSGVASSKSSPETCGFRLAIGPQSVKVLDFRFREASGLRLSQAESCS